MRAEDEASAARDSRVHVVLFKPTDLRVHDHEPLRAAHQSAKAEGSAVLHLLVLDSFFFGRGAPLSREAGLPRLTIKRASFLLESVVALKRTLAERGYSLLVYRGSTASALDVVASACTLVCVHSHGPDFTSEERRIQRSVSAQLKLYRLSQLKLPLKRPGTRLLGSVFIDYFYRLPVKSLGSGSLPLMKCMPRVNNSLKNTY